MSSRITRFDFHGLHDFRAPRIVEEVAPVIEELPPPPPPPPTFSEAELTQARTLAHQAGLREGLEAGILKARAEITAENAAANQILHRLAAILMQVQSRYEAMLQQQSETLSPLVLTIARKVAGEALHAEAPAMIASYVRQCLPILFNKPKVILELSPVWFESTVAHIGEQLQQAGFEGAVQFRLNPELGAHDIRIDWGSGQAVRDEAVLWQEIEALLQQMPLTIEPELMIPADESTAPAHSLADDAAVAEFAEQQQATEEIPAAQPTPNPTPEA